MVWEYLGGNTLTIVAASVASPVRESLVEFIKRYDSENPTVSHETKERSGRSHYLGVLA